MCGKRISGQAVALVYSWLKRQCIYDCTITMCTGRRTRTRLHTSSTKLKPLIVVPSALCTVYFILRLLPKREVSALCALPKWAHQAKQSGLGELIWVHVIISVKIAWMKSLSFKSCHVWKLYHCVLQEEHKAREAYSRKARGGEF